MPVLKGILLSIDETGTLTMTASDMDLSIEKKWKFPIPNRELSYCLQSIYRDRKKITFRID